MKRTFAALALAAALTTTASAQSGMAGMSGMSGMHHPMSDSAAACPLHLKTLDLTPAQTAAFDSIRAAHMEAMKKIMPDHDMKAMADMKSGMGDMKAGMHEMKMTDAQKAQMKEAMALTIAAARQRLTPEQLVKFDAAVAAHEAKMKSAPSEEAACMACCMECMGHEHLALPRD